MTNTPAWMALVLALLATSCGHVREDQMKASPASPAIVTESSQLAGVVGQLVTLRGELSSTRIATLVGVEVEAGSVRPGAPAEATGVLERTVVSQEDIDERTAESGYYAHRGPGTFYRLVSGQETAVAHPTWRITYADGAANAYRFSSAASGDVEFEYVPVTPETSSTGTYSGGEPRRVHLASDDSRIAELWRRVEQLESDRASHASERGKGTGAFTIEAPSGTRRFIIARGSALEEFHQFVARFR